MLKVEVYLVKHNGQNLIFAKNEDIELNDCISKWNGLDNSLLAGERSYIMQYALGHEENILCKVFKHNKGQGGIIAIYENSDLLLIAYAMDNMAYIEAIGHYAKMATYTRYGYDIFMD